MGKYRPRQFVDLSIFKIKFYPIPNHDGYLASKCGLILSIKHRRPIIMNQGLNHAGYPTVSLKHSDGTRKRFIRRVHQLIAETFIKKGSRAKLQVNHKNGIKTDNSASNLEWVTDTQNQTHKCTVLKTHRYGETHHNVKLKESDVIFIRKLFKKGYRTTQISREYGFPYYAVSDIKNKRSWRYLK